MDFWGLRFRARLDDMSQGETGALNGRAIHIKPRHVIYCSMSGEFRKISVGVDGSQKKQTLRPVFCCASGGIWQLARFPFALDWVELALAEAERLRGDFEKLVVEEEVDTLLKGVLGMRSELDGAVRGVGAHVG